jgi:hypothetical protein
MSTEMERILEGCVVGLVEVLCWHLPGEAKVNYRNFIQKITNILTEIRTHQLSNVSLEHYRYAIAFSNFCIVTAVLYRVQTFNIKWTSIMRSENAWINWKIRYS